MATDQEIRDAGFKYVPQQKYLLNPFVLPEDQEPVVNQGIVNTNAFTGGGGDNFSVYNPDPNSIVNRKYDPRPYYDATYEDTFGTNLGDPAALTATGAEFYEPPPSKLEGLMSMVPYVGNFVRGAKFLGDQISPYLPVNRRSILENELGGKGIMVDNIGRIVQGQGDYNTAENVMAGYSANNLTQKSVDKRQGTIEDTLRGKYKMTDADINAVKAGTYDGPVKSDLIDRYSALDEFGNTLDLTNTRTDKIYDFEEDEKEKKKKDTIINKIFTKRKEAKAAKDAKDSSGDNTYITKTSNNKTGNDRGNFNQNVNRIATANEENYQSAAYDSPAPSPAPSRNYSQHTKSGAYGLRKGGRAGYFYGGRVNFKNGGLASIL